MSDGVVQVRKHTTLLHTLKLKMTTLLLAANSQTGSGATSPVGPTAAATVWRVKAV